jgi:hypothetical protein
MPKVNPIALTIDSTAVALSPAGSNGNGSMSYRSTDDDVTAVITAKPGDGKSTPDRCTLRMNFNFEVPDPLDASVNVSRAAFARVDFTLPASRDITVSDVVDALKTAIEDGQITGVLNGESFW